MGKVKSIFHNFSIKTSFLILTGLFLIIAFSLSSITTNWANSKMYHIMQNNISNFSVAPSDEEIDDSIIYYQFQISASLTQSEKNKYQFYEDIKTLAPVFWCAICLLICAIVFYKMILKEPLRLLRVATTHIATNDLDFEINYDGKNELAEVCRSFEIMRKSLKSTVQELTDMIEQRNRLNKIYTHELRTPVAVLRGNTDMILKFYPANEMSKNELMETVGAISESVDRIVAFSDSMSTMRKIEDIAVSPSVTDMPSLIDALKNSADMLCRGQGINIDFENDISADHLLIDTNAVLPVYENLIGNALRFARSKISVHICSDADMMTMVIQDDGDGFSEKDLKKARQCYYSGQDSRGVYHFGLGLYVSNILCEKHKGSLLIENAPAGGARLTAKFGLNFLNNTFEY